MHVLHPLLVVQGNVQGLVGDVALAAAARVVTMTEGHAVDYLFRRNTGAVLHLVVQKADLLLTFGVVVLQQAKNKIPVDLQLREQTGQGCCSAYQDHPLRAAFLLF